MTDKGLFFVPKEINPPSCPQIRPIEQFWACLKQKVYANNWSASTRDQLISRIKKCICDMNIIIKMFNSLIEKIHKANQEGLTSLN